MSYLPAFKKLKKEGKDLYQLVGSALLVEKYEEPEVKSKGGIIMADGGTARENLGDAKTTWVRVLAVGEGYYDHETGKDIPIDVKPGDICLVGRISCQWFSRFGAVDGYSITQPIGITREEEIRLRLKGPKSYDKVFALLNGGTK